MYCSQLNRQHDNFFIRDVDYLKQLIQFMEKETTKTWLQCVHFPSTATLNYVQKVKRRYKFDLQKYCKKLPQDTSQLRGEFIPLVFWYGRTHLARTSYYTGQSSTPTTSTVRVLGEFTLKAKDHLEELWGTKQLRDIMELKKSSQCSDGGVDDFEEVHSKYGNYVFFDSLVEGEHEQHEVLYHLSGRKVVASDESSSNTHPSTSLEKHTTGQSTFNPQGKSFTTARRCMAVVPGLKIVTKQANDGTPKSRFRQNCFHCGEKGE